MSVSLITLLPNSYTDFCTYFILLYNYALIFAIFTLYHSVSKLVFDLIRLILDFIRNTERTYAITVFQITLLFKCESLFQQKAWV
jgi:hypothetical protein